MGEPSLHAAGPCQLQDFPARLETGAPSREEPWSWYVARRFRNLAGKVIAFFARRSAPARTAPPAPAEPLELAEGDLVRVRPAAAIAETLDAGGCFHGCPFSPSMYAYCGRTLRVARVVRRFFDEARWRMLKARNLVLLEGAHCDGSGQPATAGCDRMCFYFWRTEWLERA